ncbi:RTA1-like protein [Lyophyllum atratum]|nr:RTA1-like protein [Lyophyllum atratum]
MAIVLSMLRAHHRGLSVAHIAQAIRYRMWFFFPTACLAGAGEVAGWACRILSSHDVSNRTAYIAHVGPIPLVAANFIIFGRLVTRLGPAYSRLPPRRYTIVFVSCDIISLFIQGGGGGLAAQADNPSKAQLGTKIILGGIIFQLIMLTLYCCLAMEYLVRYTQGRPIDAQEDGPEYFRNRKAAMTPKLKIMTLALAFNTLFLVIRAIYRTVEFADGWNGRIISTELYFNILDGAMIVLAIYAFNFAHPGVMLAARNDPFVDGYELGLSHHAIA